MRTTTGRGRAWPNTRACCFASKRDSTERRARLPEVPDSTASMSRSLSSKQLKRVPTWLSTSESMPLGRWSMTISVTLYFLNSRAIIPKIVWEATALLRNLWASSMTITNGRGSFPAPPMADSLASTYLRWMRRVRRLLTRIYAASSSP